MLEQADKSNAEMRLLLLESINKRFEALERFNDRLPGLIDRVAAIESRTSVSTVEINSVTQRLQRIESKLDEVLDTSGRAR